MQNTPTQIKICPRLSQELHAFFRQYIVQPDPPQFRRMVKQHLDSYLAKTPLNPGTALHYHGISNALIIETQRLNGDLLFCMILPFGFNQLTTLCWLVYHDDPDVEVSDSITLKLDDMRLDDWLRRTLPTNQFASALLNEVLFPY